MRLDNFDLNLLVAFDALVAERNVTRAAQRLHLTQSAMSAALKRLREALGDPILVQHGKTMVPTHYADPEQCAYSINLLLGTAGTCEGAALLVSKLRVVWY